MGIVLWILFGLVVGVIAAVDAPARPGGFIVTILLGIAVRSSAASSDGRSGSTVRTRPPASSCRLGAIVLLALYRMMVRRRV